MCDNHLGKKTVHITTRGDKVKAYLRVIKPEWILLYSNTIREK